MSQSSFIPERQLVFSPALAATIGLEEAVLLQHLNELLQHRATETRRGYHWVSIERAWLLEQLPFWSAVDLQRISKSLADIGIILIDSPPLHTAETLVFALNERSTQAAPLVPTPAPVEAVSEVPRRAASGLLSAHWTPSEDVLLLLAMNHNIPRQFVLDQLEDFVFYWRERNEVSPAWESKFRQWVLSCWRRHEQDQAAAFTQNTPSKLDNSWQPSLDALDIMQRSGISRQFIDDAIPEFILYWRERGESTKTLNSKFINHIRRQWAHYTSALQNDSEPSPIQDNWQPTEDVFDILRMSHIDTDFARKLIPEFIMYWRERGDAQSSWNTKFLQNVKYNWANRHQFAPATGNTDAPQQGTHRTGRTRDRSLADDLSDRSWAS